ncbi:hypothetical protein AOX55_0000794 [Sinorhizobium fredii CCBAU 25509]|nr:hypothetical protein AOX55_0000794 [Sinorhizobium fredii CCBAU 25509]
MNVAQIPSVAAQPLLRNPNIIPEGNEAMLCVSLPQQPHVFGTIFAGG